MIVPEVRLVVVMLSCVGATVIVYEVELLCTGLPLSATVAVKVNVPADVGLPEIAPACDSVSPVGRPPVAILHLYPGVPPLACRVCE